ncbi:MAG: type III-A CRISPR-associated RAMP protein Csm4 [Eubacteriaceae bacterium]|jgi:CRISPR-associated protein Csm4|nr:type III-A CRISPR-associated RAMP protein Csm4 [Eubacteriaceae bacterium]
MPYYFYQFKFLTPVRFGGRRGAGMAESSMQFTATQLFSSFCIEWGRLFGAQSLHEDLVQAALSDSLQISDLFPYLHEEFYLPKPVLFRIRSQRGEMEQDKKKLKKIEYIPVEKFKQFVDSLESGSNVKGLDAEFGAEVLNYRCAKSYEQQSMPYIVSGFQFKEGAGLYFVIQTSEEIQKTLHHVVESLGLSGIGGKKSSGYGKFEILNSGLLTECNNKSLKQIHEMLISDGDSYMCLSSVVPNEDEIKVLENENSFYRLQYQGGFVESFTYSQNRLKKKNIASIQAGSCLTERIVGRIVDVSNEGAHPVFCYGKSMQAGIKL